METVFQCGRAEHTLPLVSDSANAAEESSAGNLLPEGSWRAAVSKELVP